MMLALPVCIGFVTIEERGRLVFSTFSHFESKTYTQRKANHLRGGRHNSEIIEPGTVFFKSELSPLLSKYCH